MTFFHAINQNFEEFTQMKGYTMETGNKAITVAQAYQMMRDIDERSVHPLHYYWQVAMVKHRNNMDDVKAAATEAVFNCLIKMQRGKELYQGKEPAKETVVVDDEEDDILMQHISWISYVLCRTRTGQDD